MRFLRFSCLLVLLASLGTSSLWGQWPREVRSWAYQLQALDVRQASESPFDLLVVDAAPPDGPSEFELQRLQQHPDGGRRPVLAYLSIGEAEDYRMYWKPAWRRNPPSWLDRENPDWPGNYLVKYWDLEWQEIIVQEIQDIQRSGFDGVYLDLVDAYEAYEDEVPDAARRMVDWIATLRRVVGPDFKLLVQNAEGLVALDGYLDLVDGIAREDLYYTPDEQATPDAERTYSLSYLRTALADDKLVLTVDYVTEPRLVEEVYRLSLSEGFVPLATSLSLDRLPWKESLLTRRTPSQFYAVTLPNGVWRAHFNVAYLQERPSYDRGNRSFRSAGSYTLASEAVFSCGIGSHWEAGLAFPVLRNRVWPDTSDRSYLGPVPQQYFGPGNLRILLQNGYSWNDYRNNLLFGLESEIPTDQREDFEPGLYHRFSSLGQWFGKRWGLNLGLAMELYSDAAYGNWYLLPGASVGGTWSWRDRWYLEGALAFDPEALTGEVYLEWLLRRRISLELNLARDLLGFDQGFYAQLGLTALLVPRH